MKLFLVTLLFVPVLAFAGLTDGDDFIVDDSNGATTTITTTDTNNNATTNTTNGGTANFNDDVPQTIDSTGGFTNTQQGGLDGAQQGSAAGGAVAALGAAMGAGFTAACMAPCGSPRGCAWEYCGMAAMSFADAASGLGASNSGNTAGSYLDTSYGGTGTSGTSSVDPILAAQVADGIQELENAGVTLNPNGTVTTPDGETYSASDFANPEEMIAKGMSPNKASNVAQKMADIKSDAMKKVGLNPDGQNEGENLAAVGGAIGSGGGAAGGGAYGDAGAGGGDTVIEEIEYIGGKKGKKNKRLPASQAADLKKNFNGDPIGIGMANLFLIVHKKYKQKKKAKAFFSREY